MRDFTLRTYCNLLEALKKSNYDFITFSNFIQLGTYTHTPIRPICILRHDVDHLPQNSFRTAEIEQSLRIKGSYYFRIIPGSFDKEIIKKIAEFGHEIGYHYEDVDLVLKSQRSKVKSQNGGIDREILIDLAYESFCKNLEIFRRNFEIKTVCMHGSPLSKYDNKLIWTKYDYRALGIIGEPYFDIDWNEFGYLTDTGRKWNGAESSVRDKVESEFKFNFKTTKDIINNIDKLPEKNMFTIHPQRWNDKLVPWINEYISQNSKNVVKKYFFVKS